MAAKVQLTFADGAESTVRLSPRALILAERHFGSNGANDHPIEFTFYAAWAVCRPGVDFDEWVDTIEDFEESRDADPPKAAASSELSPPSPSPSE